MNNINNISFRSNYQALNNSNPATPSFTSKSDENKAADQFVKSLVTSNPIKNSSGFIKLYKLQEQVTEIFNKIGTDNIAKINNFVAQDGDIETNLNDLLTEVSEDLKPEEKETLKSIVSQAKENIASLKDPKQKEIITNALKDGNTNNKANAFIAGALLLFVALSGGGDLAAGFAGILWGISLVEAWSAKEMNKTAYKGIAKQEATISVL